LSKKTASVVITTKNRKTDLRKAIKSALEQNGVTEVIVLDDFSTDGTAAMVRDDFPTVRLYSFTESKGYIVRRNQGAKLAVGEIIFSIDDDAEFSNANVISETISEFSEPCIGAVAIPYIDKKFGDEIKQMAPDDRSLWVMGAFIGTSHAVKKDVFLKLGGYREILIHNTEERDFCLRMLDAGYIVKIGRSSLIYHYQSPVRKSNWNRIMERRNDLIYAVCNIPLPYVAVHIPGTIVLGLLYGIKNKCIIETIKGYFSFLSIFTSVMPMRNPVSCETYFLIRYLQKVGKCKYHDIESKLNELKIKASLA